MEAMRRPSSVRKWGLSPGLQRFAVLLQQRLPVVALALFPFGIMFGRHGQLAASG